MLESRGLIVLGDTPALTPRGKEFLTEYRDWLAFLEQVGLGDSAGPGTSLVGVRPADPARG